MYLYPIWVRLWHLLNAILVIILIITGICMQHTDKPETLILVGFSKAVKWHNIAAIILTINYIVFVSGNILTGNGRYYKISRKNFFSDLGKQLRYYTRGKFKGEKHPFPVSMEQKFNPLQKLSYFLAMYIAVPLLVISGLGLMFLGTTTNSVFGVNGLILTDVLHITMGFFISVFLVIHIYACTLGAKPGSLFSSMITGYHESEEE